MYRSRPQGLCTTPAYWNDAEQDGPGSKNILARDLVMRQDVSMVTLKSTIITKYIKTKINQVSDANEIR